MLNFVQYLCIHGAGVCASVGDVIGVNNVTLTRYLLYCQKTTTTSSIEHFLPKKCNQIELEM